MVNDALKLTIDSAFPAKKGLKRAGRFRSAGQRKRTEHETIAASTTMALNNALIFCLMASLNISLALPLGSRSTAPPLRTVFCLFEQKVCLWWWQEDECKMIFILASGCSRARWCKRVFIPKSERLKIKLLLPFDIWLTQSSCHDFNLTIWPRRLIEMISEPAIFLYHTITNL